MDTDYVEIANRIKVKDCIKIQIDAEFLETNFKLIKECLLKVSSLKAEMATFGKSNIEVFERLNYIQKDLGDTRNTVQNINERVSVMEKKDFLDPILKTIHDLEVKTELSLKNRENEGFDNMVKRLEALDKFVTSQAFRDYKSETDSTLSDVGKLKSQLDRYVDNNSFRNFKDQTSNTFKETHKGLELVRKETSILSGRVDGVDDKANKTAKELQQNNGMLKEINFVQMETKLRKFKEDITKDVGDMSKKLKRIVSMAELGNLEKIMIDKIDEYLLGLSKKTADKDETKKALIFLESKINMLTGMQSSSSKQEMESLFATRQWMCAACSTSLGKYEGKLGKFKPWSVFPCRQLSPEKSGGYGYMSFVDKLSTRKGISFDDSSLQRLNQTGYSFRRPEADGKMSAVETSREKKMSSTHATNFMGSFGDNSDDYPRLKNEYFKNPEEMMQPSSSRDASRLGNQTQNSKEDLQEKRGFSSQRRTQRSFRVKDAKDKKLENAKEEAKPKQQQTGN